MTNIQKPLEKKTNQSLLHNKSGNGLIFKPKWVESRNISDRSTGSGEPFIRFSNPANVAKSLLDGNRDHLLADSRSELMKQECKVESLNTCIGELQQQTFAQRLGLEDAHLGYVESRREQVRLQEELVMKEKEHFETLRLEVCTKLENWRELKSYESTNSL